MEDVRQNGWSAEEKDYKAGKTSSTTTTTTTTEKEKEKRRPYIWRKWNQFDVWRFLTVLAVHLLCLSAPFNFTWQAFWLALIIFPLLNLSMTLSYHRNLSHRSFKLPKWLEYLFAFIGLFALQGHPMDWVSTHRYHHQFTDSDRDPHSPIEGFLFSHFFWIFDTQYVRQKCGGLNNVGDMKKQWFYRFLRRIVELHVLAYPTILYLWGGFPCVAWVMGVAVACVYHANWLLNSVCHLWGSRAWKTTDTSRNVWWLSLYTFGESWHNNHHAFQSSARHGLEWWQIDITWYVIRSLEAVGLATDVKLPSQSQKLRLSLVH